MLNRFLMTAIIGSLTHCADTLDSLRSCPELPFHRCEGCMARKKKVGQEDVARELVEQGEPQKAVSKANAARAALAEGIEAPQKAVAFIKKRFGIEMNPQHFSAFKSQVRKKEAASKPAAERADSSPASPTPKPSAGGEADLLAALETMKPLIAQYGADKVKRIVDLLG